VVSRCAFAPALTPAWNAAAHFADGVDDRVDDAARCLRSVQRSLIVGVREKADFDHDGRHVGANEGRER